ncbi:hypothetical protein [Fusibacter ferrireducens]|uniref:Uncharacterized protein n=1 Tax=Fusibacter ferrireducens TaxID=2785058 RepID=A0ABR9ZT16_9FIRM|nr:hypothetical protein [Fusibacter ferrireducens]MBF4693624.1 hypothetical protein [Fusibacter ferrireducens]
MKALLFEYRFVVAVIAAVFLFALLEWQQFKVILYQLMLKAKSMAKDLVLNSGEAQEEWVLEKAYLYLPIRIRILIPKEVMRKIIKYLYHVAKDYLDDGKVNSSV